MGGIASRENRGGHVQGWGCLHLPLLSLLFRLLSRACFDSAVATLREHLVAVSERPRGWLFVSTAPQVARTQQVAELLGD